MKILLIENDPSFVDYIKTMLGALITTVEVVRAGTLAEAMEIPDDDSVDIVLLDLKLPNGQGLEVFQKVHEHFDRPIIIISDLEELCSEAVSEGAQDFITKTERLNGPDLLHSIRHAVARFRFLKRREERMERTQSNFTACLRELNTKMRGPLLSSFREMRKTCNEAAEMVGEISASLKVGQGS